MTPEDGEGLGAVIGAAIATAGVIVWRVFEWVRLPKMRRDFERLHADHVQMMLVIDKLDDVLNHPNDTDFGVETLRAALERVERQQQQILISLVEMKAERKNED